MRLLVEYSHPAQVHKFKHVLQRLIDQGHEVLILSRDKDVMLSLLDELKLPHVCISKAGSGLSGMAVELILRESRTLYHMLRFRPDVVLSAHSVAIVHIAWLLGIPRIVHEDTEFGTLQQKLYIPFASEVVTSTAYMKDWGSKQVKINSLEPLAYLHPDHFQPDCRVLARYGLKTDTAYAVVRFVSWGAAHDIGCDAPSEAERENIIHLLLEMGAEKIILTCEHGAERYQNARLVIPEPHHFHHLLARARLCVSEGITVANEAGVLGVPTVLISPLRGGHTVELERYGLVQRAEDPAAALALVRSLWTSEEASTIWGKNRERLLEDKLNMADALADYLVRDRTKATEKSLREPR